jgi:hypothetical protein
VTSISRILTVSAALIAIGTVLALIVGLQELFTKTTVDGQFKGFYLLSCGLFFTPIALIPFRRGERWAWYTALIAGGIALVGQLSLGLIAGSSVPLFDIAAAGVLVVLWIAGISLPAKEIFNVKKRQMPS